MRRCDGEMAVDGGREDVVDGGRREESWRRRWH
jgi:hypothetical protein